MAGIADSEKQGTDSVFAPNKSRQIKYLYKAKRAVYPAFPARTTSTTSC